MKMDEKQSYKIKIESLKEQLKESEDKSSKRWNEIQELKKELKRYVDLYIGAVGRN